MAFWDSICAAIIIDSWFIACTIAAINSRSSAETVRRPNKAEAAGAVESISATAVGAGYLGFGR